MTVREIILAEIAAIRAKAEADAQAVKDQAESDAAALEAKLAALPSEVHNLASEAWDAIKAFFSGAV